MSDPPSKIESPRTLDAHLSFTLPLVASFYVSQQGMIIRLIVSTVWHDVDIYYLVVTKLNAAPRLDRFLNPRLEKWMAIVQEHGQTRPARAATLGPCRTPRSRSSASASAPASSTGSALGPCHHSEVRSSQEDPPMPRG
jgi:hypothetical protein